MKRLFLAVSILLLSACSNDKDTITEVAKTYAIAWQKGDASQMASTLHELFIKRAFLPLKEGSPPKDQLLAWHNGSVYLHSQGKKNLVEKTENNKDKPSKIKKPKITILAVSEFSAIVELKMPIWTDYLHMAKVEDEWKIINVLWELN